MKHFIRKLKRHIKRRYMHYLAGIITAWCVLCALLFPHALGRIIESARDIGTSAAYYFAEIFEIEHSIPATVNALPKIPFYPWLPETVLPSAPIPENFEKFKAMFEHYWEVWKSKENFVSYMNFLLSLLSSFSRVLLIIAPFVIVFVILFRRYLSTENNDYDKDSRPLKAWKRFADKVYTPVKRWVISFIAFLKKHSSYPKVWLILWLLYFNAAAIVMEAIAFYLYFIMSFDIKNLYIQVYKLFIDLWSVLTFFPLWAWGLFAFLFILWWRRKIGYARLKHCEMKNRGFINSRPIVLMVCGTMGKKKTTMITDMALSQEVMFRDKAIEKILENDLKFPNFPWINLENELKRAINYGAVYNLATVRKWVNKKKTRWGYYEERAKLFNYDCERYGFTYDGKLKTVTVWEVIETYSQLYFIFVIQSSLIISNYSIRTDSILSDIGNFPAWDTDFFKRDSKLLDSFSRHAHILDFDSLRLGRKVDSLSYEVQHLIEK